MAIDKRLLLKSERKTLNKDQDPYVCCMSGILGI